jgi:hypothetical protein
MPLKVVAEANRGMRGCGRIGLELCIRCRAARCVRSPHGTNATPALLCFAVWDYMRSPNPAKVAVVVEAVKLPHQDIKLNLP